MRSLLLLIAAAVTPAFAQDAVVVGVAEFPPNVIIDSSGEAPTYEGFDMELWSRVADRAGIEYTVESYSFEGLLEAIRSGEVEVGLAGITINSERIETMDFSHPYMRSGLRILTRPKRESSIIAVLRSAVGSTVLQALGYLVGFIALAAHVLYFVERGDGAIANGYFPGIFDSAWCILATMTTVGYGDIAPKTGLGRFVAFLVMVTGIGLFGLIVADLSAGLTLQQLTTDIETADDLAGRPVATVAGSTSVGTLESLNANVVPVESVNDAFAALDRGRVDAVVFDAPPLMQYVADRPDSGAVLVGSTLDPQPYGVALRPGSPLRKPINEALLAMEESGEMGELYAEWFGSEPE